MRAESLRSERIVHSGTTSTPGRTVIESIHVVTWNVEHGLRIGDAIGALTNHDDLRGADIVLLQEMTEDGTAEVATALDMHWIYVAGNVHSKTRRNFGNAVLCTWPLDDVQVVDLPHSAAIWGEERIAVGATAQLGRTRMAIWSVHAEVSTMRFHKQVEQYEVLAAAFAATDAELRLMTGDFNTASTRSIEALSSKIRAAGGQRASPADEPTFRRFGRDFTLDHVFTAGFEVADHGVAGRLLASDHYPVWVTLGVPEPVAD